MTVGRRWATACCAAEAVGMTAAATASHLSTGRASATAVAMVLAGGLIEGMALGVLQARVLSDRLDPRGQRQWVAMTVLAAGLGWAAGSLPMVLSSDSGGQTPPLWLIALGGAAIGLVAGPLMGAAQATALRGRVRHPWRWVTAATMSWPPAMAVIFVGAGIPSADWPLPVIAGWGAGVGAVAGAVLGVVSAPLLRSLDGPPARHALVVRVLESRIGRHTGDGLAILELTGARTGRVLRLPVMIASDGPDLVVFPGHPERKRWWRNLRAPSPVAVIRSGSRWEGRAEVLDAASPRWVAARTAYLRRWPRVTVPADCPLVVISAVQSWSAVPGLEDTLDGPGSQATRLLRATPTPGRPSR